MPRTFFTSYQHSKYVANDLRNRIKMECLMQGKKQKDLAEDMEMTPSQFTYNMKHCRFTLAQWLYMAHVLDVSIDEYKEKL